MMCVRTRRPLWARLENLGMSKSEWCVAALLHHFGTYSGLNYR